jgi:N-acetylmuramoyl-L-alanine amidase
MKIFIDCGHGYPDTGAVVNNFEEAGFNWYMAQLFSANFTLAEVMISRKELEKPPFIERAFRAKSFGADLAIILHCNANEEPGASGAMAFCKADDRISLSIGDQILRAMPQPLYHPSRKCMLVRDGCDWQRCYNVLEHYEMPAVLIEMGFLSNAVDREALESIPVQLAINAALTSGCLRLWQIQDGL